MVFNAILIASAAGLAAAAPSRTLKTAPSASALETTHHTAQIPNFHEPELGRLPVMLPVGGLSGFSDKINSLPGAVSFFRSGSDSTTTTTAAAATTTTAAAATTTAAAAAAAAGAAAAVDAPTIGGTCADPNPAAGTNSEAYACPAGFTAKNPANPTGACTDLTTCIGNCCTAPLPAAGGTCGDPDGAGPGTVAYACPAHFSAKVPFVASAACTDVASCQANCCVAPDPATFYDSATLLLTCPSLEEFIKDTCGSTPIYKAVYQFGKSLPKCQAAVAKIADLLPLYIAHFGAGSNCQTMIQGWQLQTENYQSQQDCEMEIRKAQFATRCRLI